MVIICLKFLHPQDETVIAVSNLEIDKSAEWLYEFFVFHSWL